MTRGTGMTPAVSITTKKRDLLVNKALSNSLDFWVKCQALGLSDLDMVAVIDAGTHVDVLTHVLQRKVSSNLTYNKHYVIVGINDVAAGYNLLTLREYMLDKAIKDSDPETTARLASHNDYVGYCFAGTKKIPLMDAVDGWYIASMDVVVSILENQAHPSFESAAKAVIAKQKQHASVRPYWVATHEDVILHR